MALQRIHHNDHHHEHAHCDLIANYDAHHDKHDFHHHLTAGHNLVPDGTSLSDEKESATEGIAVFDNGNGVFVLNDNGNLVDVATGEIANIAAASGLNQPLQFSPGADIDTDGNTACVCEITSDLVLFCDCGNGYVYFVTDDTNVLMLSQRPGSIATDPTDSSVTVIVQYVS
ncbi:hypothetical protein LQW54_004139 [Pestalotiopsis sp. IQ-011]